MKAVILAGGYATRLESRTNNGEIAKTLLPIKAEGKNQPILYYLLDKLEQANLLDNFFDEIIVVTNAKYYKQIAKACNEYLGTIDINVLSNGTATKEEAKGANADLNLANEYIPKSYKEDVMILAGDNFFDLALERVIDYKEYLSQSGNYVRNNNIVVGKVYPNSEREFIAKNFGILELSEHNRIRSLWEKPGIENCPSNIVSLALYVLNRNDFASLSDYLTMYKDNKKMRDSLGHFVNYLINNTICYAYPHRGLFYDIGTPEEYDKLCGISTSKNLD